MANRLLSRIKRWFQNPRNRRKAKRAARSAYRSYKRNKGH